MAHRPPDRPPLDLGATQLTGMRPLLQQRLVDILGDGGGYVVAPAHEMQDDIPPENIVAWVEAVKNGNPDWPPTASDRWRNSRRCLPCSLPW